MLYVGKEDKVYGQLYRGYASTGTLVPFSKRALVRAHRCFSIIAQDFSPGWPCVPAWLLLGGIGQARSACFCKRTEVRSLRLKSSAYDWRKKSTGRVCCLAMFYNKDFSLSFVWF